jgi:hypothetical protein
MTKEKYKPSRSIIGDMILSYEEKKRLEDESPI